MCQHSLESNQMTLFFSFDRFFSMDIFECLVNIVLDLTCEAVLFDCHFIDLGHCLVQVVFMPNTCQIDFVERVDSQADAGTKHAPVVL